MEQIKQAEIDLGINFSEEYKEYLLLLGCASIYGHEFTGICTLKRLDVVAVSLEQRELDANIPPSWYVIEELNIDGLCAWQDTNGFIYLKAPFSKPQKIAQSFCEYIELQRHDTV